MMATLDTEKDRLVRQLSELYAHNTLTLDDYERLTTHVNNAESPAALQTIEQEWQNVLPAPAQQTRLALFAWRSCAISSPGDIHGPFTSIMGANQIIIKDLPPGKTTLPVRSIMGLTEILAPKHITVTMHVTPILGGVFVPKPDPASADPAEHTGKPELCITGVAVLGNVTLVRT